MFDLFGDMMDGMFGGMSAGNYEERKVGNWTSKDHLSMVDTAEVNQT